MLTSNVVDETIASTKLYKVAIHEDYGKYDKQ